MLLPIRIQHYQQAKNPVTLPGEDRWVDKWDVCITCDSAEGAAELKKALLQIDADVLMSRGTTLTQCQPLEGVVDIQPIGYHSLQLIFESQSDIAKFKLNYGIKGES